MIYKTIEEMEDKKFQKWWSHHPWRIVCVNNKKLVHINILLVSAIALLMEGALGIAGLSESTKYKQYKNVKSTLSEKQLKEKYSKGQIARFETYAAIDKKMKQR